MPKYLTNVSLVVIEFSVWWKTRTADIPHLPLPNGFSRDVSAFRSHLFEMRQRLFSCVMM